MKELALLFLRLGLLGFGGPVAVMAMMEEEASRKRSWVSTERFAEIYAVCKLLPGPVSTQMAIYLGYIRAGVRGGLLSGVLFILPSFFMVLGLSWLYVNFGAVQKAEALFIGMQAAALVVILLSIIQLSKPYRKSSMAWLIALFSGAIIIVAPLWEPVVILGWGILGALRFKRNTAFGLPLLGAAALPSFVQLGLDSTLSKLFWVCFKAGAFVFGSGLAIVPLLEADAVQRFGWLTRSEFMDGLAIGQVTPGPVVITSTFIGYKAAGVWGAVVATIGMFLPGFFNVLVLVPRAWEKISGTPAAKGFSLWAIPAVIGGILGTLLRLGFSVLDSELAAGLFIASLAAAFAFRPPAWLLIPLAGAAGMIIQRLTG